MRFRLQLPRWTPWVLYFLALYFGFDVAFHLAGWWYHVKLPEIYHGFEVIHRPVLLVTAVLFGLTRGAANHPARNTAYKNWLRRTPWHPGMPLPLGPAMLHWQDGLVLLGLCALGLWNGGTSPLLLLSVFGCGYCLSCLQPLLRTRQFTESYVMALAGSALPWLSPWPIATLALIVALVLVAQEGLWRSLKRFPWEFPESTELNDPWPLRIYADCGPRIPTRRGLLIALLIASWSAALVHLLEPSLAQLTFVIVAASCFGGFIRFGIYYSGLRAPVTILGRLRAGKIILPDYDHARLAPLLAATLGGLAPILIVRAGVSPPLSAAITAFLIMAVLMVAGPQLRTWQLTGFHFLGSGVAGRGGQRVSAS
jgi:hypothetical protein